MEACAIGACANVCSEVAKGIFQEIKRHMRYVFVYKKNVDKFEGKMKLLIAKRDTVQKAVETAERNVEKIKPDVKLWCDRVDKAIRQTVQLAVETAERNVEKIKPDVKLRCDRVDNAINEDVKKVKDLEDKAKNKCFFDLCPNIKSRYQLSKKAEKGAAAVDELLQQGEFDKVGYRDVPEAPEAPKDFRAFDSRQEIFYQVIEALKDSTTSMIGVYGTGGVGKTTLVNEVARRVQKDNLFGWVAKATVTQTPNIEKIQDEIAESLQLELKEKSIQERARLLLARSKQEKKKILVVLDDIWARLDLEQVGIPFGDQQEGCKILLTSRNRDVLTNQMDAKKAFAMDVLNETEAWDLFKKMAGDDVENPELRSVATEVAKKCEGLPVAIVTVARALRSKELFAWEDALAQLQRPSSSDLQSGIPAAVFSAIELSYNHLESEELRQTFLLCGLLGHNACVEDLLRYTMGLSLFENVNTVEGTRKRVLTLVSKLKAFCLLRDSYSDDRFDMHDFDCDVALAIASRDNHAFAWKHEGVFNDWPHEEKLRNFQMISLSFDGVEKLPHQLECPQLDFFFMALQKKLHYDPITGNMDSDVEMPASFFQKMENLKVLDLIKIKISSISLPTSLRTLCLNECVLRDMVNLGKLKNLEILNLSGSRIKMLPEEIGQLTKLRLLDVSHCLFLKIPAGVLSSLSKLEELYMYFSFYSWNEGSNARLDELRDLPCLTTLNARIPDAKIVPYDLFSLFAEKLKRYRIFIGPDVNGDPSIAEIEKFWRSLILRVNTSSHQLDDRVQCLLMKSTAFYLEGPKGAKIVFSEVGNREGLLHLKHIDIRYCWDIQYIMKDNDAIDKIEFQQLQCLILVGLPQLISFCSKNRSGGSTSTPQHDLALFGEEMKLPCLEKLELDLVNVEKIWPNKFSIISDYPQNLTSLIIQNCHNLKHIVSYSVATSLTHLKSFEINGCNCLKEIILTEDTGEDMMAQVFPKLRVLKLGALPNLTRFCYGSNLELFVLKEPIMGDCLTSKTFISKSTMTNEIHIIQETEENNSEINVPHIFNEKMKFPCLDKLELDSLNVEKIWLNKFPIIFDYLQNLTSLSIQNCHKLKHILSFSVAKSLRNLKSFEIKTCECLSEIIFAEDIEEDMRSLIFPKLELLWLKDLPKLMRFWRGSYLEFTLLKELIISNCLAFETFTSDSTMANKIHTWREVEENSLEIKVPALFNEKVAFPYLEKLSLFRTGNCRKIWHDQLISDSFCNLNNLQVDRCNRLLTIFSISMSERLQNLENFNVTWCVSLEEIFEHEVLNANKLHAAATTQSIVEEKTINFAFPKLKNLEFYMLPRLRSFYSMIHTLKWPLLKRMKVCGCDKVEILVSENLLSFGESTSQQPLFWVNEISFPNLKELTLKYNGIMKEIWHGQLRAESNEVKGGIVFTRLKYLNLNHLPTLAGFCLGDHIFEFPALKTMVVRNCPKMKIFCQGDLSAPQLQKVIPYQGKGKWLSEGLWEDEGWWEGNLKNTIKWMFEEKVGCHHLRLSSASELMEIWSKNPQEILAFKYLEILEVYDCSTLRWLFTLSMALSLPQVRQIEVKNCTEMEHIIIDEGADEEVSNTIVFPLLRFINLKSCANLASFYQGSKMLEFPSLKRVKVVGCPQMFAFASSFSREQRIKTIDDGGNTIGLSNRIADTVFFDNMVAFPRLKFLLIEGMGELRKIWDDKVTINSFCNLCFVMVKDCERLSNIFPFNMMKRLKQLYSLEIVNCDSLEEIIGPQGLNSNESHAVTRTEFRLSELPELTHLSKEELPYGEVVSKHFGFLKVSRRGKPTSFATLPVAKINNLGFFNTHLERMLKGFKASTSDEVMDGTIFSQLRSLELHGLSSLSRFCSGNYMLGFPSLEKVIMRQCPKMEIFSKGELSTPKLRRIEGDYVGRWEGNLNATIQQLFKEKSVQNSEEEIKVSF